MTQPNTIPLAPKTISRLLIFQTLLTALQTVAAATVLGDVLGPKIVALSIVVISGGQQAVNGILSKTVATHVESALSRMDSATEHAETAAQVATDATHALTTTATRKRVQ